MSGYGGIIVMGDIKNMSLESSKDPVFGLAHILNAAVSTCNYVN